MGFVRFVLVGILVFIILRFLSRLVAEVRSFMTRGPGPQPGSRQDDSRREAHRDIQDATFEDVTDKDEKDKAPS